MQRLRCNATKEKTPGSLAATGVFSGQRGRAAFLNPSAVRRWEVVCIL